MRTTAGIYFQDDDAASAVKGDFIDIGKYRRLDLRRTKIAQLLFDAFRVFDTFNAQLIIDAENDCPACGVGQRDDFRR